MKKLFKNLISIFNYQILKLSIKKSDKLTGSFFRVRLNISKSSTLNVTTSLLQKAFISILGDDNICHVEDAYISNSNISLSGNQNSLKIYKGVKLRNSIIQIRGNNCNITIGQDTTFGGIRIVNVGSNNEIIIGSECLFSDNIELWASDTHPIYDQDDNIINTEKPVKIGNKVWVGSRVIILKGVTVHDGSILGMGSVILNDVPSGTVSAGYPNKVLKRDIHWKLNHE